MRALPWVLIALTACTGRIGDEGGPGATADAPPGARVDSARPDDAPPTGPDAPTVDDPGTEGDGDFMVGPDYVDAPENTVPDGTPRGRLFAFTMDSSTSAIFPGLEGAFLRGVWVHVPAQYVDGTAAPFMLVQDGQHYHELWTPILDTLIAARQIPPQITIFIQPGPGDGRGSQRGLEYDTVSDAYYRFIETEVLPIIPAQPEIAAAYPGLRFTTDPEGRASAGFSSGGAAAFTMGWFHPEKYRRIVTYSGTFVNQAPSTAYPASAWEYHQHLIAEAEEKSLRVFLAVGERDNNLDERFGDGQHDWVAANRAMAAALAAKTYHYRFVYALDGAHVDLRVTLQTLPETLRWVWRGYPIP